MSKFMHKDAMATKTLKMFFRKTALLLKLLKLFNMQILRLVEIKSIKPLPHNPTFNNPKEMALEKEKMLVTTSASFFPQCFMPYRYSN